MGKRVFFGSGSVEEQSFESGSIEKLYKGCLS
jgi:hypothetical protein